MPNFGCTKAADDTSQFTTFIPGPTLPRNLTHLTRVDFTIDHSGRAHVISCIAFGRQGAPLGFDLYYQKEVSTASTGQWTDAVRLIENVGYGARILAADHSLHIIAGGRLSHRVSANGGTTWMQLEDLTERTATSWDVVTVGDTLIIAYLTPVRPADELTQPRESELRLLRWTPDGMTRDTVLARFPIWVRLRVGPRLRWGSRGLHLLCCIAGEASDWSAGVGVPFRSGDLMGQLLYGTSRDAGRTWSALVRLPLEHELPAREWGSIGLLGGQVPDFDLAETTRGIEVVASFGALVRYRSPDGFSWQGPDTLDRAGMPEPSGPGRLILQLSVINDTPILAWISERYLRTYSEWLSVDGWHSNDILVTRLPAHAREIGPAALRITGHASLARSVRCQVRGDTLVCIWNGYLNVNKKPPEGYDPGHSLSFAEVPFAALVPDASPGANRSTGGRRHAHP